MLNTFKEKYLPKIKNIISKKRFWAFIAFLVLIFVVSHSKNEETTPYTVSTANITEKVVATGEVTSQVDLSLGFKRSGTIEEIPVSLGQSVKKGQVLARLSLDAEDANLTKARGALLKAEAEYEKELSVSGSEGLLELELQNEKVRQDQLVENAYRKLLSSDLEAIPDGYDDFGEAPTIGGSYVCDEEGEYEIDLYSSSADSGYSFTITGLETGTGTVLTESSDKLGSCGLTITFPEGFDRNAVWVVEIPNTQGDSYADNLGSYELALATRESTISELERELEIDAKSETTSDIAIAYADLVSAQGEYQSALAKVNEGVIYAPSSGVVTKIDGKLGSLVQSYENVITIQDVENLYVKANINESNISEVSVEQEVEVVLDALGPENKISGTIQSVDFAPSKEDGVVNYEIAVSLSNIEGINPGMTSTVYIIVGKKDSVLSVPSSALLFEEGKTFVYVSENMKKKKEVFLGLRGDDGMIEVVSGVSEGEIIYIPK